MENRGKTRVRRGSARALLQAAARDTFAELGYGATTREIADRAGVSRDLIFRYFESKEKLFFEAVVHPLLETIDGQYRNWVTDLRASRGHDEEVIRAFTSAIYGFFQENREIALGISRLFTDPAASAEVELIRDRVDAMLTTLSASVAEYLSEEDAYVPRPGLQLRIMLIMIVTNINFLPYTYAADAVPPADDIIDALVRVSVSIWT